MSLVRVHNFSISLDGFGVGEDQRYESPFSHAEQRLDIESVASPSGVVHVTFTRKA